MITFMVLLSIFSFFLEGYLILLMGEIISSFDEKHPFALKDWGNVVLFLTLKVVCILITNNILMLRILLMIESITLVNNLLFDKTGRINSNSKSLEEGKLVNLIQNDSFKIGGFMHSITSLICLPVSIFVNLIYLFRFSLLNGTIILSVQCLTCFSVIWLSFQFKEVNKKLLYERDGRMKIINDSFQDITSMKLLGWEDEILKRV